MYQQLHEELLKPEYSNLSDAAAATALNDSTTFGMRDIPKQEVNNHIVSNNLNLNLRRVVNTKPAGDDEPALPIDTPIPQAGGLTVRDAAQGGLDFLLTDSGGFVNPNHENTRGLIDVLAGAGVFSADEIKNFWAMFKDFTVTADDVKRARNWANEQAMLAIQEALTQAHNDAHSFISRAIGKGEVVTVAEVKARFDATFAVATSGE
jgi:hypothetical protein